MVKVGEVDEDIHKVSNLKGYLSNLKKNQNSNLNLVYF
jgi:hypothetical protein